MEQEMKFEDKPFNDPRFVIKTLPKFLQIVLHVMGYSKDKIFGKAEVDWDFKQEMEEVVSSLLVQNGTSAHLRFIEALLDEKMDPDHFKLYSGHFLEIELVQSAIIEQSELF